MKLLKERLIDMLVAADLTDDERSSLALALVARRPDRTNVPDIPEGGWQQGFMAMLAGCCPWCGLRMQLATVNEQSGLTWKCEEGCNP